MRRRMSASEGRPVGHGEELGLVAVVLSDRCRESGFARSREAVRVGPPGSSLRRTSAVEARSSGTLACHELAVRLRGVTAPGSGLTLGRWKTGGVLRARLPAVNSPRAEEGFGGLNERELRLGAVALCRPFPDEPLGELKLGRLGAEGLDRLGELKLGWLGAEKLGRLGPARRVGEELDRLGAEKLDRLGAEKLDRLGPLRLGAEKLDRLGALRLGAEKLGRLGALRLGAEKLDRLGVLRLGAEKLDRLDERPPLEARAPPDDDLDPPPRPDDRPRSPPREGSAIAVAAKKAIAAANTAAAPVHETGFVTPAMALPLLCENVGSSRPLIHLRETCRCQSHAVLELKGRRNG